jgi:hypothetical protein
MDALEQDASSRQEMSKYLPKHSRLLRKLYVDIIISWYLAKHPAPPDSISRAVWMQKSKWSEEELAQGIRCVSCMPFHPISGHRILHPPRRGHEERSPSVPSLKHCEWALLCSTSENIDEEPSEEHDKEAIVSQPCAASNHGARYPLLYAKNSILGAICIDSRNRQLQIVSSLRFDFNSSGPDLAFSHLDIYPANSQNFLLSSQQQFHMRVEAIRKKLAKKKFTWAIPPPDLHVAKPALTQQNGKQKRKRPRAS